jgi:hypothetical protein
LVEQEEAGHEERDAAESLDGEEARELARLLLSDEHTGPEIRALFYAWDGSIRHMAPGLATLPFETFSRGFEHLTVSCRLPHLSRDNDSGEADAVDAE